jgi:hypothetical protein
LVSIETNAAKAVGIAPDAYPECMKPNDAVRAVTDARLSGGLLAPLIPSANKAAWDEAATIPASTKLVPARPGAVLDFTGDTPVVTPP